MLLLLACADTEPKPTRDDSGTPALDSAALDDSEPAPPDSEPGDSSPESGDTGCASAPDPDAACDDGDACTVDRCEAGACVSSAFDGEPLDLWDLDLLRDASTLDLEVVGSVYVLEGLTVVEVQEIRYTSYAYDGCTIKPVRIEAFVAIPDGATPMPGLVVAHGLGAWAEAGSASTPAAALGTVAIAYSGPGQGNSEGTGSTPDHLFDTASDPRNSWFWEHAAAAIRALTVLEQYDEVDPDRLAITGYSAGSVISWMVAGIDDRITTAFPVSATGHLDLAIAATPNPGWEYDLLQAMTVPKTAADIEWLNYERWLDPKNYLPTLHAPVLLVNGAQDEFFPLTSTLATLQDAQAAQPASRLLLVPNWDHGWYAYFTGDEATALAEDTLDAWMGLQLETDSAMNDPVPMPQVDSVSPWTCYDPDAWWLTWSCSAVITSVPDLGGYTVASATFWFSVDNALTFTSWNLQEYSDGVWYAEVGTLDGTVYTSANTVWFVDVELSAGWLGPTFHVTSLPSLPSGFSPYILPTDGPIP